MIQELKAKLEAIRNEENNLRIYFVTKNDILFKPQLLVELNNEIITDQINHIVKYLNKVDEITEHNLDGNLTGEVSYMKVEGFNEYNLIKQKILDDDCENLEPSNVDSFYNQLKGIILCIGETLMLFKKFSYPKRLKGKNYLIFQKFPLTQIKEDIFSIDNRVDFFQLGENIYINSEINFEIFFSLESQYHEKIVESKQLLIETEIIENVDEFINDCCSKKRSTKKLLNLLNSNNFEKIKENIQEVKEVITEFALNINIENGKIIYENDSNDEQILNLLGDKYYTSTILKEKRLAKTSETLN